MRTRHRYQRGGETVADTADDLCREGLDQLEALLFNGLLDQPEYLDVIHGALRRIGVRRQRQFQLDVDLELLAERLLLGMNPVVAEEPQVVQAQGVGHGISTCRFRFRVRFGSSSRPVPFEPVADAGHQSAHLLGRRIGKAAVDGRSDEYGYRGEVATSRTAWTCHPNAGKVPEMPMPRFPGFSRGALAEVPPAGRYSELRKAISARRSSALISLTASLAVSASPPWNMTASVAPERRGRSARQLDPLGRQGVGAAAPAGSSAVS